MNIWRTIVDVFSKNILLDKNYYPQRNESDYSAYYNNYDSGDMSDGSKWSYGLSSSGAGFYKNLYTIRQNARSAYNESIYAKLLVDRTADIDIDQGIMLESTPNYKVLGITPEQAEEWGNDVDEKFHAWALDQKQNRSRSLTFYQGQRLYSIVKMRDGEVFCRLFYSNDNNLQNPLQFDFIDANQIRGASYINSYVQDNNNDGIVRDEDGVATAYKIWIKKDSGYVNVEVPAYGPKSNRPMMLHGYNMEYVGQGRGCSGIGHMLQEFENLTDLSLSHIKKAIIQSQITMFVKPSNDKPASNPMSGIPNLNRNAGPVTIGTPITEPAVTEIAVNPVRRWLMPEATIKQAGQTAVFNLQEGEDLSPFETKAMSDSFESFSTAFFTALAASASIPIETALMKFSQNYSASRAALVLCWKASGIRIADMNADFNNPVKESWLTEEIAAGRIKAPGYSDPRLRAAWNACQWISAPMPNIDPQKTANADQLYLEMGATTQNRIARNYNGSNAKNNLSVNKRMFAETPVSPFNKGGSFASNKDAQGGE